MLQKDKESEFASSKLNEDDVRRDMEQLVLDQRQQGALVSFIRG